MRKGVRTIGINGPSVSRRKPPSTSAPRRLREDDVEVAPRVARHRRRRSLRSAAPESLVAAGLTLFGVGLSFATPLDDAPPRPRPGRPAPPGAVPPSPAPASPAELPFDPVDNPTATIGERFAYPLGLGGYQVPMRFDLPAADPTTAAGSLVSAKLELDIELRIIPEKVRRTEGTWFDGVLSGTTWAPVPGSCVHLPRPLRARRGPHRSGHPLLQGAARGAGEGRLPRPVPACARKRAAGGEGGGEEPLGLSFSSVRAVGLEPTTSTV